MCLFEFLSSIWHAIDTWVKANESWAAWVQAVFTIIALFITYRHGTAERRHQLAMQKAAKIEKLEQFEAFAFSCENVLHSIVAYIKSNIPLNASQIDFEEQREKLEGQASIIKKRMSEFHLRELDAQEIHYFTLLEFKLDAAVEHLKHQYDTNAFTYDTNMKLLGEYANKAEDIRLIALQLLDSIQARIKALK